VHVWLRVDNLVWGALSSYRQSPVLSSPSKALAHPKEQPGQKTEETVPELPKEQPGRQKAQLLAVEVVAYAVS
jgi:hypothetical protein